MGMATDRTGPTAMHPRRVRAGPASVLLSIVTLFAAAHADTLTYGIDAGVGETDNVTLVHADTVSQTIAVTDFDVAYKKKSQRLDVDAKGDFSYFDYLQNAYRNQLVGRFDGAADVALIPQRLTWTLQEDYGQAAINPFTPSTPTNLETINTVATGPDLHLRLSGASFVDLSARVAHAQFEKSPFTNSRATASASWGINLSPASSVSLNGDSERVLFENTTLNTDFERTNGFVRYELKGARTDLSADLGATRVGEGGSSPTGGLARVSLARKLSASARLNLTLGHEITDGTTSFSGQQGGAAGGISTAPATNTSQNYTSNHASLGWEYQRNRTTLGLTGRWEKDSYPGQAALDRTLVNGELLLQRSLTRAFALQIAGRIYKSDYNHAAALAVNGSPNNTTNSIAAGVTWRHGRALEVKLACEHTSYTTAPNDTGYRENRVFVTVGYRPFRESQGNGDVPAL